MILSRNEKIRLGDVLHGTQPGRMQSVGYMQVIPLVSELSDDRFVSPVEGEAEVFTSTYGTLGFRNPGERLMIVPCHAGYVVKQAAQDHAMAHTGLVKAAAERRFNTAMCVQQSQGGLIARGAHRMLILPYALRQKALDVRKQQGYDKLWNAIASFNQELGLQAIGHLDFFLKQFAKELDEFVAEFECVPNQIGAIILVDGQVVGVERAPSHAYWQSVWPCLIRECYGSLAIRVAQAKQAAGTLPVARPKLPEGLASLAELESAIEHLAEKEDERARSTVRGLLDLQLSLARDETVQGVRVETVEHERFGGQLVREKSRVLYASLPVRQAWLTDDKWRTASPFAI